MAVDEFPGKRVDNIGHIPGGALPENDVLHLPPSHFVSGLPITGIPHSHSDTNALSGEDSVRIMATAGVKGSVWANGIDHTVISG